MGDKQTEEHKSCIFRQKPYSKLLQEWKIQIQPPEVICKNGVLKNFANFTGKHFSWSVVLIKLQAFRQAFKFIKKRLQHRCFPVKFEEFKNTYFKEHLRTTASENIRQIYHKILPDDQKTI